MNKSKQITVHVGTLTHGHGTDVIVARSKEDFNRQLAVFCREWWRDMVEGTGSRIPKPRKNAELIEAYFEAADGIEFYEYLGARTI